MFRRFSTHRTAMQRVFTPWKHGVWPYSRLSYRTIHDESLDTFRTSQVWWNRKAMKYSVMLYPKFEFIRHGQSRLVSFARVRDHLLSREIAIQLFYVLLFKCILKLVLFPTGLRVLLKKVPKAMIKMLSFILALVSIRFLLVSAVQAR